MDPTPRPPFVLPLPPLPRRRSPAEWALSLIAATLAFGNVGLGLVLLLGGKARTGGASFRYLLDVASPSVYGVILVVAGALALGSQVAHWGAGALLGHGLAGVLCAYWAVSFARAATAPDGAAVSLTGVAAYGTIAACHLIVSVTSIPDVARR